MNPSLWFCVPAYGRLALTAICLRQLRRSCDSLCENGVDASAVVVADDANLDVADELGFATVRRDNRYTSRKFNDAIQLATDPRYNHRPADYVVPLGSDDWVDWRLFHNLPAANVMVGYQRMAFVREDGRELTVRRIMNEGGCGIRIYSRQVMARVGYRPADEDRPRGCDTSILNNIKREVDGFRVEHRDLDPLQIVDWKSPGENLNPYDTLARHKQELRRDPFELLRGRYPDEAVDAMADHYSAVQAVAA